MTPGGHSPRTLANLPHARPASHVIRELAEADYEDVIALTQELVRVPTRGGVDVVEPLIELIESWLTDHGLVSRRLQGSADNSSSLGVICDVVTGEPGPQYVLDACLDTAPFGIEDSWRYGPTSGKVVDGWLHGRGAADSKAAIVIFMHIAKHVQRQADSLRGTLTLLFDADEHTGHFGGAKRYFADAASAGVKGVMIGYPGIDHLVVGGRGFLRANLGVRGQAGHTGGSQHLSKDDNAVEGAADLVRALSAYRVPGPVDLTLELAPKLTITGIRGGSGFSTVPDQCSVEVDIRLTKSFDETAAEYLLNNIVRCFDANRPTAERTTISLLESWPAYITEEGAPIRLALTKAAERHLADRVTAKVAGPSNIGNYLSTLGIPATAGLGVRYAALHGTNERVDITTIPAVQATYHQAVMDLLSK